MFVCAEKERRRGRSVCNDPSFPDDSDDGDNDDDDDDGADDDGDQVFTCVCDFTLIELRC